MRHIDEEILALCNQVSKEEDASKSLELLRRLKQALEQREVLTHGILRSTQSTPVVELPEPKGIKSARKKKKRRKE